MRDANFTVAAIHDDVSMRQRDAVMQQFRSGADRLSIATDGRLRSLDVRPAMVIKYDLAHKFEIAPA